MTFFTHGFWVSVVLDVRERVQDLGAHFRFMLRRASFVEYVSVLHGTCLQCAEIFFIHQYVQPCLSKNSKYTFANIYGRACFILCERQQALYGIKGVLRIF
jgi:hypothetical protein